MLTSTASTATRFGALGARGLQLQPCVFARGATSPYSSLAQRRCSTSIPSVTRGANKHISRTRTQPISTTTTHKLRRPTVSLQCRFPARRHATTTTSSAASAEAASSSTTSNAPNLDWDTFFQLRKTRRRFQLGSSLLTMFVGGSAGATLLVNVEMDWFLTKVPMDPFFALGIITISFAGLGWLAGPSLGNAMFYVFKRGVKQPMAVKESEFFARIKKHRVDPSNSSLSGNAVPDFYGEKISSVAGYRQWLKDQRAFNKKRTNFV